MKHSFVFLSLLLVALIANAQDFKSANTIVREDLQDSLTELSAVRESIAKEKIPLLQEITRLEDQVEELIRQQKKLRFHSQRPLPMSYRHPHHRKWVVGHLPISKQ